MAHDRVSKWRGVGATALLLSLAACGVVRAAAASGGTDGAARKELSSGYSLLYQEADGIPKLNWLLMFKSKPHDMGRLTEDLVDYYGQLADSMKKLSQQYPAMRIDATAMFKIESATRKAIGEDQAREFAPLVGETGVEFERKALLMFYDALNEQRHLTKVMLDLETVPALRSFLETTKVQLEARYAKVGALLERRYFTQ